MKNNKKEADERPHFVRTIDYNQEPWLTDFIFGQKGKGSHAHATISGAIIWYLRGEEGKEIINNGSVVSNNTAQ